MVSGYSHHPTAVQSPEAVLRWWDSSYVAPAPRSTPRWVVRFRADQWSRDKDRALIAEGWDRFRGGDEVACGLPAQTEVAARAQVVRVLHVKPDEVIAVAPDRLAA